MNKINQFSIKKDDLGISIKFLLFKIVNTAFVKL